ncbi:uncharacterized protein [Miscanthus floridulus]|uniref:uncharacterized protein n=1 Tax=Miscanthus floridulus TaxID=154761 RepID=UPI00345988C1
MAKSLRDYSTPAVANVPFGPAVNTRTGNFEMRTGLITMVQANQFCGLLSEDTSAHLQHFLEMCDTIVIKDVAPASIRLRLFPFSLAGKQTSLESIPEAWERLQNYIQACPHHGMEEWLVLQNFYEGLTSMSKGHIDAAAGEAFLSLTTNAAKALIEKMVANQSWGEERKQQKASIP